MFINAKCNLFPLESSYYFSFQQKIENEKLVI